MTTLTAVVAARDEREMIVGCIDRLRFADEVLVIVDDRTIDDTAELASQRGASVITATFESFAALKNIGIDAASGDWVLVVDADERVPTALAREITQALVTPPNVDAFSLPRQNYFFGHQLRHGGWVEEHIRLFRRDAARYRGDIHEQLVFHQAEPLIGKLIHPLAHFSHRTILDNLRKTAVYADVQAHELARLGVARVTARTFAQVIVREFWIRMVRQRAWRDGITGVIEAIYQPLSLFAVQVRLWELQQDPPIEDLYRDLEASIDTE